MNDSEPKKISRRDFLNNTMRVSIGIGLAGLTGFLFHKSYAGELVWQLDASKCTQCGRCATSCVMSPSAVKCTHVYAMCGYCNLCGSYFKPETKALTTAAETMLCPTNAIQRKFVESPYFVYHINEDLCIGCGKCVKGCGAFGNGSMQLQIKHDRCKNCNECSIARVCPSDAFARVPAKTPYKLKSLGKSVIKKDS